MKSTESFAPVARLAEHYEARWSSSLPISNNDDAAGDAARLAGTRCDTARIPARIRSTRRVDRTLSRDG